MYLLKGDDLPLKFFLVEGKAITVTNLCRHRLIPVSHVYHASEELPRLDMPCNTVIGLFDSIDLLLQSLILRERQYQVDGAHHEEQHENYEDELGDQSQRT